MPSPFPGMDPYLEGYLWPDVHNALASKIRQQLTPKLRPRYTARLEVYVVEDSSPNPDVPLNLSQVMADIYDEAAYDLSIDYTQPPPPPYLSQTDARWVRELLS